MQKTEAPEGGFGWVCMSSISPPTTREGNIIFDPGNRLSVGHCCHQCMCVGMRVYTKAFVCCLCFASVSLCAEKAAVGVLVFCWKDFQKCKTTFLVLFNPCFLVPSWPEDVYRFSPFFCDLKIVLVPFPCHSLSSIKVVHSPSSGLSMF